MHFGTLIPALFLERLNRFVCLVELEGRKERVLLRNTGRLKEILMKGRSIYLRRKEGGKYRYELILADMGRTLVCLDSHLPPKLLIEYMERENYPWELKSFRAEFGAMGSRFDLLINDRILVETKSVNLVRNSVALFPDAPTERGRRHVKELIALANGYEPAVIFVVQREDAKLFSPNYETDPEFSRLLLGFYRRGYRVQAFACKVSLEEICIDREIPIRFTPHPLPS